MLENRPYHFDQWMVILQRWEPVIFSTFPSLIPFWVELQGLPKHFSKQQLIYKIGEELGEVLSHEISPSTTKIRVLLNGLEPLTKETVVEFSDGQEALVTLDYKNLKKHCHHCQRLTHEVDKYPGLGQEKALTTLPALGSPAKLLAKSKSSEINHAEYKAHSRDLS